MHLLNTSLPSIQARVSIRPSEVEAAISPSGSVSTYVDATENSSHPYMQGEFLSEFGTRNLWILPNNFIVPSRAARAKFVQKKK